jgi:hypothetical protein
MNTGRATRSRTQVGHGPRPDIGAANSQVASGDRGEEPGEWPRQVRSERIPADLGARPTEYPSPADIPILVVDGEPARAGVRLTGGRWEVYWLIGLRKEPAGLTFAAIDPRAALAAAVALNERAGQ